MQINGLLKIIRVLIVGLCLTACDITSPLLVNDAPAYCISSKCGVAKITGTTLVDDRITLSFTGDFIVNIDSLKISVNNFPVENKKVAILHNNKLLEDINRTIHINGHDTILLIIDNTYPLKYGKDNFIDLLPSSFITCNKTPLITNVIRMRKYPKLILKPLERTKFGQN